MKLGDRLRSIRRSKSVSLKELERRTNVRQCYWSSLELGYYLPTLSTLEKWAGALNVPLYKLFYEEGGDAYLPKLTIEWDTWFELSTLCKRLFDSFELVDSVLELAKNKSDAHQQPMYLRAIWDNSLKGHQALTRFAYLWAGIVDQTCKEGVQFSPEEVERLREAARQSPIPEMRLRWSEYKSRKLQQVR